MNRFIGDSHISYVGGYKYQLRKDFSIKTTITPGRRINTDLVSLDMDGWLLIRKYFAWDGCSGPTIDDSTNMRAGLVHDALYYLMREGLLDINWRPWADELLYQIMIEDGACKLRAGYYRWAVRKFAAACADPSNAKIIKVSPIR